ncbi:NUDIX domain-containing protein [Microbacterium istanbulense]|uniref:NUDIX domain-containing protein n=1 Tax=Microbacterium istanbulense TaxID=3122049 RepID=A0ABU8LPE4_9MICO
MTIVPPQPGEPRRPDGPRDSGDAWVVADSGERYWGRYGAAGLLAYDPERGVLLQHRVSWSHFGGTWALPGGALHEGESALDGALREAQEEAGIPEGAVRARFASVHDIGIWSYTTVVADVLEPFEPVISDPESVALEWVPVAEVDDRPLHPGFAEAWKTLRDLLDVRPVVVVDAANVVGSKPDGWWKDRAGAAARLRARVEAWARAGVPAAALGLGCERWYPPVSFVVEGAAKGVHDEVSGEELSAASAGMPVGPVGSAHIARVTTVRAPGHGDDGIVVEVQRLLDAEYRVTLVTSDRGLRERAERIGAHVDSAAWLLNQLPAPR